MTQHICLASVTLIVTKLFNLVTILKVVDGNKEI